MNQCNLYRTIKEDRHWGCTHGRKRSTALHHVSREQRDDVTLCWSRAAVLGDTCDNRHNTGIFRTLKTENDDSLVRNFSTSDMYWEIVFLLFPLITQGPEWLFYQFLSFLFFSFCCCCSGQSRGPHDNIRVKIINTFFKNLLNRRPPLNC